MKRSIYLFILLTIVLVTSAWAQQKAMVEEQLFASPDEAVKTLQAAVQANDKKALNEIFGPQFQGLLTGDQVQDANNTRRFATSLAQGHTLVQDGDGKFILEVGTKNWPMPIPLVKENGNWYFDTGAGKEEIINRHIGKDELNAIGVCRAYVTAQQKYAGINAQYAQRFKSSAGNKDGLYWPTKDNEAASPLGPLVMQACAEGYCGLKGPAPHPFHGYYFRILTRQGKTAPGGKMDYMDHGKLARGYALVAYPVRWGQSGIMTFIVNQKAQVFQRNFGTKTSRTAGTMRDYNPDNDWTLVQDEGEMLKENL